MRKALYFWIILGVAVSANANIFMSEYVEGSSFNKALELYNNSGINVLLDGYTVLPYHNGSATPTYTIDLTGFIIGANGCFVLANPSADPAILAVTDLVTGSINFNGDDAIELQYNGVVVDSFGQVGVDPGSEWPGGGQDDTLRRKSTILTGDTNSADPFDASVEWDVYAVDTFAGLGIHTIVPEPATIILLGLGSLVLVRRKK